MLDFHRQFKVVGNRYLKKNNKDVMSKKEAYGATLMLAYYLYIIRTN